MHKERHIRVRGVRREDVDLKKLSRALIALAMAQAQAEKEAEGQARPKPRVRKARKAS